MQGSKIGLGFGDLDGNRAFVAAVEGVQDARATSREVDGGKVEVVNAVACVADQVLVGKAVAVLDFSTQVDCNGKLWPVTGDIRLDKLDMRSKYDCTLNRSSITD